MYRKNGMRLKLIGNNQTIIPWGALKCKPTEKIEN